MAPLSFSPLKRPDPVLPDSTLDEALIRADEDATFTLFLINVVVVGGKIVNKESSISGLYCHVEVNGIADKTTTTTSLNDSSSPVWNHKMKLVVPHNPEHMTVRLMDNNVKESADASVVVGTGSMDWESLCCPASDGSFEGYIVLKNSKNEDVGTITLKMTSRRFTPLETEIKLQQKEKELECKFRDEKATLEVLDESERLREEIAKVLVEKEQEISRQADELVEKERAHASEMAEKERELVGEKIQLMEARVQEMEAKAMALEQAELRKQETETKLKAAEEEISKKQEELERKEKEHGEAIAGKEQAILAATENLHALELAQVETKKQLEQAVARKLKLESELAAKAETIQDQSKQLEELTASKESISQKEKELEQVTKKLSEVEAAATTAQNVYDDKQIRFDTQEQANELLRGELDDLRKQLDEMHEKMQQITLDSKLRKDTSCWGECLAWS